MKKIKKLLALTVTGLMMSGLSFAMPQNTTTASAGIIKSYVITQNANVIPNKVNGNYKQMITINTKDPRTGKRDYCELLIRTGCNGYLNLEIFREPDPNHVFDDDIAFIVMNTFFGPRLKWTSTMYKKSTINEELIELVNEFNRIKVGCRNNIAVIGKNKLDSVKWSTSRGNALIRHGYNNYDKGYTDEWTKYGTMLEVTNNGLDESKGIWGNRMLFTTP